MENLYSLDEISKMFDVPKSTLRYWESQKLIKSIRNSTSGYREYGLKELIGVNNIVFYRTLHVSIERLKKLNMLNSNELENIIIQSRHDIEDEILLLQDKLKRIDLKLKSVEEYKKLKDQQYGTEKPDISVIVSYDLKNKQETLLSVEDSYNFSLMFDRQSSTYTYGVNIDNKEIIKDKIQLINEYDITDKKFLTCLLEVNSNDFEETNLQQHLKEIERQGYRAKDIIFARYLLAAINDDKLIDFYKLWIEVE